MALLNQSFFPASLFIGLALSMFSFSPRPIPLRISIIPINSAMLSISYQLSCFSQTSDPYFQLHRSWQILSNLTNLLGCSKGTFNSAHAHHYLPYPVCYLLILLHVWTLLIISRKSCLLVLSLCLTFCEYAKPTVTKPFCLLLYWTTAWWVSFLYSHGSAYIYQSLKTRCFVQWTQWLTILCANGFRQGLHSAKVTGTTILSDLVD